MRARETLAYALDDQHHPRARAYGLALMLSRSADDAGASSRARQGSGTPLPVTAVDTVKIPRQSDRCEPAAVPTC
jgi:hypothetical protein